MHLITRSNLHDMHKGFEMLTKNFQYIARSMHVRKANISNEIGIYRCLFEITTLDFSLNKIGMVVENIIS